MKVDTELEKYFQFEDNLEIILNSDVKVRKKMETNRYLTVQFLNCYGTLIVETEGLSINDAVYTITSSYCYNFGKVLNKKVYNYIKELITSLLPKLVKRGYLRLKGNLYYITEEGKYYLSNLKKANSAYSLCYNNPYKDYYVFYINNMSISYLSLSNNNQLASMCKDYEFALESFNFFLERLIAKDVLTLIDDDSLDEKRYYMEKDFYYQLILLLAIRNINVLI